MADYKIIVPKAQSGDPKALDELYKSTSRAVYFTCLSLLKNEQDAEDLTQNTYITAFRKLKTLANPEKFEPWIKRIAANLCKDFLLKKGAHPNEPLDEEGFDDTDENFLPDEYVINAEKRSIVMQIMRENLSDVLYQTVIMFYFDEMSVAAIAEEMNCPEGTVKYRLNAARAKVKKGVLDYEKKSGDKLYAFAGLSGLPFLTRLLTEEAEAASVPALDIMSVVTQNSSYVPDIPNQAAVDPNFTANTVTRIGGKMLGTLKAKIIAGAVAAAVVAGGGVTAAVVVANNSAESGYTSRAESTASDKNVSNNDRENSGSIPDLPDSPDLSDSQFWFARQKWTEAPRSEFAGGILADKRKTLDLREIDGLSAPFFSSILYSDDKTTDKFSDIRSNPHEIAPYDYVEVETRAADVEDPNSPYDGIGFIDIINFDTEPLSVEECLENGWWKTYAGEKGFLYETVTLGFDNSLSDDSDMPYEDKLMDAVIAKFGTPDYVRYSGYSEAETDEERRRAIYDEMAKANDPQYDDQYIMLSYDLIYELGNDVIMSVVVWEQRNPKGEFVLNLDYVEFWGSGCWENRFEFGDKEDNDREEISLFPVFNESGSGSENRSDSPFWYARQVWTEAPRKTFEGGILRDNRKTLDLREIDGLSAPFFTGLAPTDNWITDKFSDIWYNDVDISSIYFDEINTQYVGYGKEPLPYDGIGTIQIYNFDNIPHLVEDCLENGWWKTYVADERAYYYETVALGLDSSLSRNNENYVYEEELVNAVIEKFGTPHYIYYPWVYNGSKNPDRRAAIYEDMESILNPVPGNEMHFIQYQFVYEFENDIVMCVYISENRNDDGRITLNVDYTEFWGGACWENRHTVMNMDYDMDEIELFNVYEP